MNKKKILTTLSIAAVAIVSGYGNIKTYQSHAYEANKEFTCYDLDFII